MVDRMIPERMRCTQCGIEKTADEFFHDKRRKYFGVIKEPCKRCTGENVKRKRAANPELFRKRERESAARRFHVNGARKRERHRHNRLKEIGLTFSDLEKMLKDQNGGCAICNAKILATGPGRGSRNIACLDHNHANGALRGLLCHHCNTAIGLFKDSVSLLRNATAYLEAHSDESSL